MRLNVDDSIHVDCNVAKSENGNFINADAASQVNDDHMDNCYLIDEKVMLWMTAKPLALVSVMVIGLTAATLLNPMPLMIKTLWRKALDPNAMKRTILVSSSSTKLSKTLYLGPHLRTYQKGTVL